MAKIKVLADKQTGQTLYAPNLSMQGHKNKLSFYQVILNYNNQREEGAGKHSGKGENTRNQQFSFFYCGV